MPSRPLRASPCFSVARDLLRAAREDVRVDVERLADAHLLGHAEIAERDLARHRPVVRDGEDLHAEVARAIRLGEQIAVGLHAVGEDHGAPQVPGRVQAVGELHRAREIGGGAEAGALAGVRRRR